MPLLTRWAIRAAMIYLLAGVTAGALYWLNNAWVLWRPLAALNPVYIHLLVVGWVTQLIFGVIYWMFPIISKENMRGNTRLGWAALIILNLGLILRAICEPWRALEPNAINQIGLVASAALQVAAGFSIVVVCWPRVRERAGK
jgi:hypothetical protein